MIKKKYLAIGDSYTVGEGLESHQNFPNLTVKALFDNYNVSFETPLVIATTGWTTDELSAGISLVQPAHDYDFVTLLIGVNNQYRNRSVDEFAQEFEVLLDQAIQFAKGEYRRVIVLSIPDWGHTPFAKEKAVNEVEVAEAIHIFNARKQEITLRKGVRFLDITSLTKNLASNDFSYLVEDQLHYSEKLYKEWADLLAGIYYSRIENI